MKSPHDQNSGSSTASFGLLLGGAMWGLYWIPVRYFEEQGLHGSWSGVVMFVAGILALLPFLWPHRRLLVKQWRFLLISGVFTGAAFSLYSTSLVYTEVVRSILLFYLTPIWGTLLGILFLQEKLHARRVLGLFCGIGGLLVVLGGDQGIPLPKNAGDWMALLSGMAWAVGSLGLYQTRGIPVPGQVFAFLLGALLLGCFGIVLETCMGARLPTPDDLLHVAPWVALSAAFVLPMMFLTIWPATLLSPARVGLLLMSEVIVGLFSAAMLSGEPFGYREVVGAALIVSAAILEIVPVKQSGA